MEAQCKRCHLDRKLCTCPVEGPQPKWLEPNHDRARKSNKFERKAAAKLGGRRLPGSGGKRWSKPEQSADSSTYGGDIKTEELLIEHKRCEPHVKSITVKREWLSKVTAGARRQMKYPALLLHFEGAKDHEEEWVAFPMSLALRVIGKLRNEE